MKKNSIEEISKHLLVSGGNEDEHAAAVAVIASLLAHHQSHQQLNKSDWSKRFGMRVNLDLSWQAKLRT